MDIKTVTVLGANGAMGAQVSGIFASFGNAKVYMLSRNLEDAKAAVIRASKSIRAKTIECNLIPKTYEDLEACLAESDFVFESLAENLEVKRPMYEKLSKFLKEGTVIGTGTSGLSIKGLANNLSPSHQKNFFGVHFFNPPYVLNLCEVIPSEYSDKNILNSLKIYLSDKLLRSVVEVKDAPAFLGNRIGFQFINEAIQYAEKYQDKGGIDYIDTIIGGFTGRSMAPINTADFVGLDVHKAIVDNLHENTNDYARDTYVLPSFVNNLIRENKLGRKSRQGFYKLNKNEDGSRTMYVYDIKDKDYRVVKKYDLPFVKQMVENIKIGKYKEAYKYLVEDKSEEAKIAVELLLKYVIYSLTTTKEIGESIHSADDVMANGFGWITPLSLIELFGGNTVFEELASSRLSKELKNKIDISELLTNVPSSKYDYRQFLKAR